MRLKKSATLIKRSQTIMKTKQLFLNSKITVQKQQLPSSHLRTSKIHEKDKDLHQNLSSFKVEGSLKKTFSRKGKSDYEKNQILGQKPKIKDSKLNGQFVNNNSLIKNNPRNNKSIPTRSLKLTNSKERNNDKVLRTTARNIADKGTFNVVQKKKKVYSIINPEESRIKQQDNESKLKKMQIPNTRRSKIETDTKKRSLVYQKKAFTNPLTKTKNVLIHKVNNQSLKKKQKQPEIKNYYNQFEQGIRKGQQTTQQQLKQSKSKQEKDSVNNISPNDEQSLSQRIITSQNIQIIQKHPKEQQEHQIPTTTHNQIPITHIDQRPQPIPQASHQQTSIQNQPPQNVNSSIQIHPRNSNMQLQLHPQNNFQQLFVNRSSIVRQNLLHSLQRQQQRYTDLTSLIANTQDIIEFINRLNLRNRVQTFDLMVEQLSQLNLIAQQVHELGQMGNSLGYSLFNVFGTRIRELQTTIINQVGQALIASFQERMQPQFQLLVMREPSLRSGFSKADVQKTFNQKITIEETECSICLDYVKPGQYIIELQCYHQYHPICIKTWLDNSKKCPLCRKQQIRVQP